VLGASFSALKVEGGLCLWSCLGSFSTLRVSAAPCSLLAPAQGGSPLAAPVGGLVCMSEPLPTTEPPSSVCFLTGDNRPAGGLWDSGGAGMVLAGTRQAGAVPCLILSCPAHTRRLSLWFSSLLQPFPWQLFLLWPPFLPGCQSCGVPNCTPSQFRATLT
jgi:hypothetical protein